MQHLLNSVENPDFYLNLKKTELEALKFKSSVVRFVAIIFFLMCMMFARENLAFAIYGLIIIALAYVMTSMVIQSKLGEFCLYQDVTRGGYLEFQSLFEKHQKDLEIQRFVFSIDRKKRKPLMAELLRLKKYIKEKEKADRSMAHIANA